MKRYLFTLLIVSLAAFSCGKEGVESADTEPVNIAFATSITRGTMVNTPLLIAQAGGFSVWAYSHTGEWAGASSTTAPILNNETVTSSDGLNWSYGTPKEWPQQGDRVSFFAYAPAGAATLGNAVDGVPVIDFTVDENPLLQKDLTVATPQYNLFGPDHGNGTPVSLLFNHALSLVRFSAIVEDKTLTLPVKVSKVVLRSVYNSGSMALNQPNATPPPATWTVLTTKSDYTLTIGSGLSDITLNTIAAQIITADNGMLFLMPQTVDRQTDKMTLEVTLNYDGQDMTYTTEIFSPTAWLPGKAYDYQIVVEDGAIRLIVIDSNIELTAMARSATTQSIMLTADQTADQTTYYSVLGLVNILNGGMDAYGEQHKYVPGSNYFGIYGTLNLTHDITIDLSNVNLSSFTYLTDVSPAQYLIFDFRKTIGTWGQNTAEGDRYWQVKVEYNTDLWTIQPSNQGVDGNTGATTLSPSNVITGPSTVFLMRKAP